MSLGSGLFSKAMAKFAHLIKPGGGLSGEIYDVRQDILTALGPLAAMAVEDIQPVGTAAPGTAALHAATATVTSTSQLLAAALVATGVANLLKWPRQITFTTAGSTASDAPANVVIVGTDQNGAAATETLVLAQTAATVTSVKYYSTITSLTFPAGDGTGATIAVGIAAAVLSPATATVTTALTVQGSSLIQTDLYIHPRQLVFTTAGSTASDAPANVVINGTDAEGKAQSETLVLAQTATTATSVNFYASITSLVYPAADGTGATIAVSFAAPIGLHRPIKTRTGAVVPLFKELMDGTVPTAGAVTAAASALPYGSYTPNTAADGVHKYAIYYEYSAELTG